MNQLKKERASDMMAPRKMPFLNFSSLPIWPPMTVTLVQGREHCNSPIPLEHIHEEEEETIVEK